MSLRVHMLGAFHVYQGDVLVPPSAFVTQKPLALLKILLTHRGHFVASDQVIEWLWPAAPAASASAGLRSAVSRVRRALEPDLPQYTSSTYIHTAPGGYLFLPQPDTWVDVDHFEQACAEGQRLMEAGRLEAAISALNAAQQLYGGAYLEEDRYEDWATLERERLREMHLGLLTRLSEAFARLGRYQRAVALSREILVADPCRESVWQRLMLYHYHAGDRALALRVYEECRRTLAEELGDAPLAETAALAQRIRSETVVNRQRYPPPAAIERVRRLPVSLSALPFVGRDGELVRLVELWEETRSGNARAVVIEGEAGVGKTRLVHELLACVEQQGALVLEGKARELAVTMPYQPFVDAMRSQPLAGRRAYESLDPIWQAELGRLVPELAGTEKLDGAGGDKSRLFEAVTRYILMLSRAPLAPEGIVLFLDDLQWMGQASTELLAYLGSRLAGQPVLLIGTLRPEESPRSGALQTCLGELQRLGLLQRLSLSFLAEDALNALVFEASHGSPASPQLARHLYTETRGHPLFLVSLLQTLFEDGVCHLDEQGRWSCDEGYLETRLPDAPPPKQISRLVQERLERLDIGAQRLLALASVIGRPFDLDLLRRASAEPQAALLDAVDRLVERGLLHMTAHRTTPAYDFSHDLVRRTVYGALSPDRRAWLHQVILSALEQSQTALNEETVSELAYHAVRGRAWIKAVTYCKRAGEVALDRFALHQGLQHYEQGLTALQRLESDPTLSSAQRLIWQYDILAGKQLALHLLGQRDSTLPEQLLAIAEAIGDRERLAHSYYALLKHHIDTGQNAQALELVPPYAELIAQGVTPTTAIAFHQRVGFLYYRVGDLPLALEHHDAALGRARTLADSHLQAQVLNTRGHVLVCLGRYEEALADYAAAGRLWEASGRAVTRAFALSNGADVLYYLGCYQGALAAYYEALPIFQKAAYPIAEAEVLAEIGVCLHALDRWVEAEKYLQQALTLSQSIQDGYDLVQTLNGLAALYVGRTDSADYRQAELYARQAVAVAEKARLPHGVVHGLAYQALAWLRLGKLEEARTLSTRATELLRERRQIEGPEERVYFIHAEVLAANGYADAARVALQQAYAEMMAKADRLSDPKLRCTFLEQVPANRAIQARLQPAPA